MYDKIIKQVLDTENIPSSAFNKKYINKRLKELGEKEGYNINDKFTNRLKDRIYSQYGDGDFFIISIYVLQRMNYERKKIITLNML